MKIDEAVERLKCLASGNELRGTIEADAIDAIVARVEAREATTSGELSERLRLYAAGLACQHWPNVREDLMLAASLLGAMDRAIDLAKLADTRTERAKAELARVRGELATAKKVIAGPMDLDGASFREAIRSELITQGFKTANELEVICAELARVRGERDRFFGWAWIMSEEFSLRSATDYIGLMIADDNPYSIAHGEAIRLRSEATTALAEHDQRANEATT